MTLTIADSYSTVLDDYLKNFPRHTYDRAAIREHGVVQRRAGRNFFYPLTKSPSAVVNQPALVQNRFYDDVKDVFMAQARKISELERALQRAQEILRTIQSC